MTSLHRNETGAALITAILVVMLASGLMAGMFAALMANQRTQATDRDQSVAYAAAHAGLEKLTANLGQLFEADFSPNAAQIAVVDGTAPTIPGFEYRVPGGAAGSGYDITFTPDGSGNPQALSNADITTGPFEGLKGLITPYILTATLWPGRIVASPQRRTGSLWDDLSLRDCTAGSGATTLRGQAPLGATRTADLQPRRAGRS